MTTLHFLGDRESQDTWKNMGIHTYHFFETNCGCVFMGVYRYTLRPCHWKPLAWKTLLKARNKSFRIPTFLAKWNFLGSHRCFLKWWVSPTTMGFPTKNAHHLGCEMGVPPFYRKPSHGFASSDPSAFQQVFLGACRCNQHLSAQLRLI